MTDLITRAHAAGYCHTPLQPEPRERAPVPWWAAAVPFVGLLFVIALALIAWGLR